MTVNDVIHGFFAEDEKNPERTAYGNDLFQEAICIGMELDNQYHTPEEIREVMGRLTGKEIDETFRLSLDSCVCRKREKMRSIGCC